MPTFIRKYGILILPAAIGGGLLLAVKALYLFAIADSSFGAGWSNYAPKIARPAPQKAADWNLGR